MCQIVGVEYNESTASRSSDPGNGRQAWVPEWAVLVEDSGSGLGVKQCYCPANKKGAMFLISEREF